MAKAPHFSQWKERLTVAEAAQYLSAASEPVSEADVLRLAQEEVLQLSVRFLDTIYGEYVGVRPPYDEDHPGRLPLPDGEVFSLPMIGAGRLGLEEAYRRLMGPSDLMLNHTDALLVDDDIGDRFRLYHRPGDYSPVTRLPDHAVLLLRREVLDQFLSKVPEHERAEQPLRTRERDTLYAMIAALCRFAKLDISKPSEVDAAIKPAMVILIKDPIALRTVQRHLLRIRRRFGPR